MYPHHKKGTVIVPAVLLAHELGHAWFTQYNSEQKEKWREIGAKTKWKQDIEHEKYIHGMSGVESNFSMAMHGTIRAYRIPKEKPDLKKKYNDLYITTEGSTSSNIIKLGYNH